MHQMKFGFLCMSACERLGLELLSHREPPTDPKLYTYLDWALEYHTLILFSYWNNYEIKVYTFFSLFT